MLIERRKFAVIGIGRFGLRLVEEFSKMGLEVIAIDSDSFAIEKVRDMASESLIFDVTHKETLEKSGVKDVDLVIVSIGKEMENSVVVTTLLKEIGVEEVISRAESRLHAKILKRVGADHVVFPEEDRAVRLAHTVHFPGVQEYIDMKGPWDLAEFKVPIESKIIGKEIKEIRGEFKGEVDVLMVEKAGVEKLDSEEEIKEDADAEAEREREERESILPTEDYKIEQDDILILFARPENLEKFIKKVG